MPTLPPPPVTTLSTPSGTPASAASSASRSAVRDETEAGLRMTLLPAARAGPSFQDAMSKGKFHGTMTPTTPSGSRVIMPRNAGSDGAISS